MSAETLASPLHAATGDSVWKERLPVALGVAALFGWLLWSVSARQALLLLVGLGLGWGLARHSFGFTTAWRNLVQERDPAGVYGQLVLLALLSVVCMAILARFPETRAALGPPSWSVLIGAFVFGACMQLADGCGSGTLYKAGMGVPLNMAVLPMFVIGSFAGSAQLGDWLKLGAMQPVGLVQTWGLIPALAATLLALFAIGVGVRLWSGRKFSFAGESRHWLWGALALTVFAALNMLIAGQPWGIVYGFGLWGAKAATALGIFDPTQNVFWSNPGHAMRLSESLLLDVTSITDIGILIGAWWVAMKHPRSTKKRTAQQWIVGLVAGFFLGYSSRMAFGCNIGAMVSGISTGSLHGWIWVPMAFLGSTVGLRLRARLEH
jgi:hypothetical protein